MPEMSLAPVGNDRQRVYLDGQPRGWLHRTPRGWVAYDKTGIRRGDRAAVDTAASLLVPRGCHWPYPHIHPGEPVRYVLISAGRYRVDPRHGNPYGFVRKQDGEWYAESMDGVPIAGNPHPIRAAAADACRAAAAATHQGIV